MEKTPSNTFTLSRRIGSTNYRVNAHFSEKAAETFEDKIFHLIQNEGLESETKCANLPRDITLAKLEFDRIDLVSMRLVKVKKIFEDGKYVGPSIAEENEMGY